MKVVLGAANEMGGVVLDKGPEVSLEPEPFCTSMFTSSASAGETTKLSVSTTFVPSDSLNKKPPTLLLILL